MLIYNDSDIILFALLRKECDDFPMSSLTRGILIVIFLLCSAFFSMTECAFSYCNQIKLKVAADEGDKSSKLVLKCLDKFDRYIITNLIGNNIVNIMLSVFSTTLCVLLFTDVFNVADSVKAGEYGAVASTVLTTVAVFFFGEIIPKSIGKTFPNKICKIVVYPLVALSYILMPLVLLFDGLTRLVKLIFKTKEDENILDEEDFVDIVDSIEEQGLIEEEESTIIQSAVEFDETRVKQVMCPRDEITALDIDKQMSKDELIDYILDNPYTRIPVYKDSIDNIIGILHTQKLLKEIMQKNTYNIEKLLVEPIFVRPNVHLDTLFEEFRKKRTHMAVVQSKDEETLGVVTMEDLIEELVGDLDNVDKEGDSHE